MTIRNISLFFVAVILAAACGAPVPTVQPRSDQPRTVEPQLSPIQTSPLPSPLPTMEGAVVPFKLDRPILPGATEVRGTGPAGVPVFVADVTFMGESLGTGTVGHDGKFVVAVKPLEENHRIGLALGVLEGTAWKPEDFYRQEFYGPEAMQVPQVGFFHDTVLVGKK